MSHNDTPAAADPSTITCLLHASVEGDAAATDELWHRIHDDVRRMAKGLMAHERSDDSLESAGLVNEVYINLLGGHQPRFENRAHFFGAVANKMKQILINRARRRNRLKRGGGRHQVPLDNVPGVLGKNQIQLQAIDDAINQLEGLDPRKALVVRMRFFMELTIEETAALLGVARRTVINEWTFARAWLHRELSRDETSGGADFN